jgi:microsomal dipeptidase-like Zn-dependent dipeptidase
VLADFHAHYPMHLVPGFEHATFDLIGSRRARARLLDRARAALVHSAGRLANYETFSSGPRVTVPLMRKGGVGVALSVLYSPFDEMDLALRYGSPPEPRYFATLLRQLEAVERDVAEHHAGEAVVAHGPAELDDALGAGRTVLVHCVEGAFHLGATPEAIEENVGKLARLGVAYITVSHLFWRGVATNAPAIPFLPDRVYKLLFPQPPVGLTDLGRACVRACAREHVLIDLAHMGSHALRDTFDLLDGIDPERTVPLVCTHAGYRFGHQEYNLAAETIDRIAGRGGLIGVILSEHQAAEGLRPAHTFEQSLELVCLHLDRIREITGSHEHSAIGSDLDGFIKPTLAGMADMSALGRLEAALVERYGAADGEAIASGNLLRLLRSYWRAG